MRRAIAVWGSLATGREPMVLRTTGLGRRSAECFFGLRCGFGVLMGGGLDCCMAYYGKEKANILERRYLPFGVDVFDSLVLTNRANLLTNVTAGACTQFGHCTRIAV